MKHLRVKAKIRSDDDKHFDLHIIEQSHLSENFGGGQDVSKIWNINLWVNDESRKLFFVHEDIVLCSNSYPLYVPEARIIENWGFKGSFKMLQLKGTESHMRPIIRKIPLHLWPKIKSAILAYNEFYK